MAGITLRAGEPLPATGTPHHGKFQGWVLIQLWEPTNGDPGVNVNISTASAEHKTLLHRAADEIAKIRGTYD